jgi:hypothetical protein
MKRAAISLCSTSIILDYHAPWSIVGLVFVLSRWLKIARCYAAGIAGGLAFLYLRTVKIS